MVNKPQIKVATAVFLMFETGPEQTRAGSMSAKLMLEQVE